MHLSLNAFSRSPRGSAHLEFQHLYVAEAGSHEFEASMGYTAGPA